MKFTEVESKFWNKSKAKRDLHEEQYRRFRIYFTDLDINTSQHKICSIKTAATLEPRFLIPEYHKIATASASDVQKRLRLLEISNGLKDCRSHKTPEGQNSASVD